MIMIPYLGCKERWVKEFLFELPGADNFYDLFGGGGSVTEAAFSMRSSGGFFSHWSKFANVCYNEIKKGVFELNKMVWEGSFDFERAKNYIYRLSGRKFHDEKSDFTAWGSFVKYVCSFGNKGCCFMYSAKMPSVPVEYFQRLNRVMRSPVIASKIFMSNRDYRDVAIKPNSIVYCDIPYFVNNRNYYYCRFDFPSFFDWAFNAKFPVYFSSYELPEPFASKFGIFFRKSVPVKLNTKNTNGKALYKVENVYWNGVVL
jgi:site-specific DNA-adenine methylase